MALLAGLSLIGMTGCADVVDTPRISQAALDRAHQFLKTPERGTDMLNYLHLGAAYHGHRYVKTIPGDGGSFALVYRFNWESDGVTDVAFLCDEQGNVESMRIEYSNGQISQPFALANLTIGVVGKAVFEAFKDQMTVSDQRKVHQLIQNADAKSLLEWSLHFQQVKT
jgi:hypothetical protein